VGLELVDVLGYRLQFWRNSQPAPMSDSLPMSILHLTFDEACIGTALGKGGMGDH
jgi:hypothetical protein